MKNKTWTIVLDKSVFLAHLKENKIQLDGASYFEDEDTPYILALHDKLYCRQGWDPDRMKDNYADCKFVHFSDLFPSPFDSDPKYLNQKEIDEFIIKINKYG